MMRAQRAEDLAWFVVTLGMAPDDYWRLTVAERNAIVTAANRAAARR